MAVQVAALAVIMAQQAAATLTKQQAQELGSIHGPTTSSSSRSSRLRILLQAAAAIVIPSSTSSLHMTDPPAGTTAAAAASHMKLHLREQQQAAAYPLQRLWPPANPTRRAQVALCLDCRSTLGLWARGRLVTAAEALRSKTAAVYACQVRHVVCFVAKSAV
jgi:hypothetical protein